jgi:hypothetical protein
LLVTLGVTSASAGAAPTGREVVAVCERALARGFQGIDAAMCAWYTAPCECKIETASRPETEQWCLAPDMPEERMVRDVLARLRAHPSLNAPVDTLVPGILADLYPCR